jgi:hypothetical protein
LPSLLNGGIGLFPDDSKLWIDYFVYVLNFGGASGKTWDCL